MMGQSNVQLTLDSRSADIAIRAATMTKDPTLTSLVQSLPIKMKRPDGTVTGDVVPKRWTANKRGSLPLGSIPPLIVTGKQG